MTRRAVLKAVLGLSLVLFLFATVSGMASAIPPQAKVRVAFIYPSAIGDFGWAYSHDVARKELAKRLDYVETAYTESVPDGAEAERVLEAYLRRGYNLIVATSFGYMDTVVKLAKKYPKVAFLHATGFKTAPNMSNYFGRMYEARYLAGIAAAKVTKSGILGYVAGFPIPDVLRGINAFLLGARSVNPKTRVNVVWTQSWYDPAKEREGADALMDVGADVIHIAANSPAPLQAADRRGRYSIGFSSDMSAFAPKGHLMSVVWNWTTIYEYVARNVHDGTFKGESIWWGFKKGAIELSPYGSKVTEDVRRLIEKKKKEIIDGKLQIYAGPLRDQKGKLLVPKGQVLTDREAFGMNFLLEGVVGTLP